MYMCLTTHARACAHARKWKYAKQNTAKTRRARRGAQQQCRYGKCTLCLRPFLGDTWGVAMSLHVHLHRLCVRIALVQNVMAYVSRAGFVNLLTPFLDLWTSLACHSGMWSRCTVDSHPKLTHSRSMLNDVLKLGKGADIVNLGHSYSTITLIAFITIELNHTFCHGCHRAFH